MIDDDSDNNADDRLLLVVAAINPALALLLVVEVEVAAALILVNGNRMFDVLVFFCGVDRDTVSSECVREREMEDGEESFLSCIMCIFGLC